jgi:hypothetical protein
MSTELQNIIDAIKILENLRINSAGITFAWKTLDRAGEHLQAQVKEHFV